MNLGDRSRDLAAASCVVHSSGTLSAACCHVGEKAVMYREGGQGIPRGATSAPKKLTVLPARPRESNEIDSWPVSLLGVLYKDEKDRWEASAAP